MKRNYHYIIYTCLLLLVGLTSCREETIEPEGTGSISGQVFDEDNIPLANVLVSTAPASSLVMSDSLGQFQIDNIKAGSYTVRGELAPFAIAQEAVTVVRNETASVLLQLLPPDTNNVPPDVPFNPMPAAGTQNTAIDLQLQWEATDADEDTLTYDVHLYTADQSMNMVIAGLTTPTTSVNDLSYGTTYYWQVKVSDGVAIPVNGPVWNFRTESFPDHRFLYVMSEGGNLDIFSSNTAMEGLQLTQSTAGSSYRPRMSPDRSRIAFISNAGIDQHLFTMNRDGSNVQQVTQNIPVGAVDHSLIDFAWSPDGTQLLYMNFDELYRINIDGTGLQKIADAPSGQTFIEVDWSGTTNRILARTIGDNPYNSTINLYDLNGTLIGQPITDGPGSIGGGVFSIDGNFMLYTKDVSGFESPDGRQLDSRIFLRNLTNGQEIDLSINKPAGTNDLNVRFSPDGAQVIFTNTNNDGISPNFIFIMNLDGEGRTLLFENAFMPEWG